MKEIPVINKKGEKVGVLKLSAKSFDGKVNKPLLQQVLSMYMANKRQGNAATKTRGEVSGGGKKPWRQKGTGRARHGSNRSPIWRGGGTVFGPHPKNWHYSLPQKMRKIALKSALNAKILENNIIVIDDIALDSHKTKELFGILKTLKLGSSKLMIVPAKVTENFKRASRNIESAASIRPQDLNAYDVLITEKILIERTAIQAVEKELEKVA